MKNLFTSKETVIIVKTNVSPLGLSSAFILCRRQECPEEQIKCDIPTDTIIQESLVIPLFSISKINRENQLNHRLRSLSL